VSAGTRRPLVKICGITNEADGRSALAAGADLLGFVLAESPRRVSAAAAAALVRRLRRSPGGRWVLMVGVFKDAPAAGVLRAARAARFDLVQLHGAEPPGAVARVAGAGFPVMKVIRRLGAAAAAEIRKYPMACAFLLEKPVPGSWRGTARTADWSAARAALAAHPRVGIAGNLSPANAAKALRQAGGKVWLIDAASTLEKSPGVKDHGLVRALIAAVKAPKL
jgi:phosphoribosylanthranilate isomerase